jgi:hypothetical protein
MELDTNTQSAQALNGINIPKIGKRAVV